MIKFLLKRPTAVIMTFLAAVILGCVTFATLPVSLLPDVAIPHIAVQVSGGNMSAGELESTVVAPLRRQLMQVSGLDDIKSETRDASAMIDLTMQYGVNTDLAFIEVNEKIDAAINSLPREVERPRAVKASATDIPVLYIYLTARSAGRSDFLQISEVADNVVRRRLEQLPQVSMVDISGVPGKVIQIIPDYSRMKLAGITTADIESAVQSGNSDAGSMMVNEGYYEFNIQVSNSLRTVEGVRAIKIKKNGLIHTLGSLCRVDLTEKHSEGYSTYNGRRAVSMAIIKHSSASMDEMEKAVTEAVDSFASQYQDIEFSMSRSQTQLLDFTISNLKQNLILGLILVFVICAVFMRSLRLPLVIGITIVAALIVTFLIFYLFHVSLNIISLAGLVLAVGMMIDNSVIVAENITQYRQRGMDIEQSCIAGTNEMIAPMLSSSLTTVAVFVPLVFMSGIAGAIFADQAFAITAGLAASYIVGITLMPVLYHLFFKGKQIPGERSARLPERCYEKGMAWIFSHKTVTLCIVAVTVLALLPLFRALDTERMPKIDSSETVLNIDWNENISLEENRRRTELLTDAVNAFTEEFAGDIGVQDYMIAGQDDLSRSEAEIYFRVSDPEKLHMLKDTLTTYIRKNYPAGNFGFSAPVNIFERVFSASEPPLEARLSCKGEADVSGTEALRCRIMAVTGEQIQAIPLRKQLDFAIDQQLLELYEVDYSEVLRVLKTAFRGSQVTQIRSYGEYVPIEIVDEGKTVKDVLDESLVKSRPGKDGEVRYVPLKSVVRISESNVFKTIHAGGSGRFVPFAFDTDARSAGKVMDDVRAEVVRDGRYDVSFAGALFSNRKMMGELAVIMIVSLLMMYFILCAQFESFIQPLIILLEIPIDVSIALLSLLIFGQTLNVMSAIGIVVTCGIVVNDSILKLDAVNELCRSGMPLVESIHTAGVRRLKPIIMTSLTTIFAIVPVLFTSDMGSELQRPLAIAMIGSMIVGTLVSIFIIPLFYYLIYRTKHV